MLTLSRRNDSPYVRQALVYFGLLTLLAALSSPGGFLIDIQTSFMLKNNMNATPTQVSMFRLLTAFPVYLGFVFGLVRDRWDPLGLRDRGYFLIFAPVAAIAFLWLAFSSLSYRGLLVGMLAVMVVCGFLGAAYQGLMALLGQERLMSGRLSALSNVVGAVPGVVACFASGYISNHLRPQATFILVAALTACIGLLGLWKPRSVFSDAYDRPQARGDVFFGDIRRLVKHRAVYPAVIICWLWNFSPGSGTPLQFYLTDKLHASDAAFSYYYGIFGAAFIPTFLLYGYLCRRIALNKLLWWGTIVGVPQMIPLVFIHSANLSLIMAVPMGLTGGVASAAYIDLAMRSCPPGLQGTLMGMIAGAFALSARGGDLLGSRIYNSSPEHGFLYCVIATTVVYALILPLIPLVPKELIATADGEPNPGVEAALLKEAAGSEPILPMASAFGPEPGLAPLLPLSVAGIVSVGDANSADPANSI